MRQTEQIPAIRTATQADADRCISVLTLAFAADAAARWVWPDPHEYAEAFPPFVRAFGGRAFDLGTAFFDEDLAGVALWLPPGVTPDDEAVAKVFEDTVAPERRGALFALFEQFDAHHPEEPHWHLPLIGVDPARQGRGVGSALQRHVLDELDRERMPAYLEATGPRNAALYARLGFERVGTIRTADSPTIVPMLRRPAR